MVEYGSLYPTKSFVWLVILSAQYVCFSLCVCVCVRVCERAGEGEGEGSDWKVDFNTLL